MQKISMAITTLDRPEWTVECFKYIHDHPRVSEIVIVDDLSTPANYALLSHEVKNYSKVKLFQNRENLGMIANKLNAISLCKEDFVLIADSDNVFTKKFIDNMPYFLIETIISMPDWAMPDFDYRQYAGTVFDLKNIKSYLDQPMFNCALNTCNYIVPKTQFLAVYEKNDQVRETDTLWLNYLWLKNQYQLYIVPGMRYLHRVHKNSGWLQNADYNTEKAKEITEMIKKL